MSDCSDAVKDGNCFFEKKNKYHNPYFFTESYTYSQFQIRTSSLAGVVNFKTLFTSVTSIGVAHTLQAWSLFSCIFV